MELIPIARPDTLSNWLNRRINMSKYPFHRSATEEDYRKLQNYSIGTFHRISALTGKVELVPLDASDRMQEALDAVEISLK